MGTFDATIALHQAASISWGIAGIAGLASRQAARGDRQSLALGLGLAAGAWLHAANGPTHAPDALPLMAWALLSLAALRRLWPDARASVIAAVAVAATALLHVAHAALPTQPMASASGLQLLPLELATGVAFAWLVVRGPTSRAPRHRDARWLLLTTAVALVLASCSGAHAATVLAVGALVGVAPLLARTFTSTTADVARPQGSQPPSPQAAPPHLLEEVLRTHDIVRDLREPLTSVLATATLADVGTTAEQQQAMLQQLRAYAREMNETLEDIDELDRLLRDRIDLADETFDLPRMLAACVAEIAPKAADRAVAMRIDVSPSLPRWVQGDPARTRHLVARLLQLASNRCTIGPVDVSAAADEHCLHVVLLNHHSGVEDPDSTGVVFAHELARAMGGRLSLRAREVGGTEFHLQLPKQLAPDWEVELQDEPAAADDASAPPAANDAALHGRVLLVTGNPDHRRLLAAMLAEAGADVVTADSREVALLVATQQSCDLALVDMQMIGGDGARTVRELREHAPALPVLAISSELDPEHVERDLAAGCNGHLAKPVERDVLLRALAMHLAPVK